MLRLEKTLLVGVSLLLCALGMFFIFESGVLASFRASGHQFSLVQNQLLGLAVGVVSLVIASKIKVEWYLRWPYFFYALALGLILLCFWDGIPPLLHGNEVINGARRWVWVMGISVQVAEIVKFCLIIFWAYLLPKVNNYQVFLVYLSAPTALILLQKDLGSLLVVLAISGGLYFLSGVAWRQIGWLLLGGVAAVLVMIATAGYRSERVTCWLDPDFDPGDTCYHINQLMIAIGRGELMGEGISASRQKFAYVPEVSSDSIFAIVAEEVGFVGVSVILGLYMFFLYLIWRITQLANLSPSQKMVGYGIFLLFLMQTFMNLGAISGLIPLTGITLPFFSAGGSSLVISLFLVGVVLSLAQTAPTVRVRKRKYV
jgi:cell division protein FtsW